MSNKKIRKVNGTEHTNRRADPIGNTKTLSEKKQNKKEDQETQGKDYESFLGKT